MTACERIRAARRYHEACQLAREVGVPVSLDDPDSPGTVLGLLLATYERMPSSRVCDRAWLMQEMREEVAAQRER